MEQPQEVSGMISYDRGLQCLVCERRPLIFEAGTMKTEV
jgi:hypothetical protein